MPILETRQAGGYYHFDQAQAAEAGGKLADLYQSAAPFPHIVMEDFIDAALLRRIVAEFPDREGRSFFDRKQERFKYQFNPNTIASGLIRNLLVELNSEPVLAFMSAMTGIEGLIADPYFNGGGLHETLAGGHLSVHADFNLHTEMKVERRLNLLVYLNDDWPEEYGGQLELWDMKMRGAAHAILPVLGRAVVFNTTLKSYHGQPDPVRCPDDRSRRSIAIYYYTALPDAGAGLPVRGTNFRLRSATADARDWASMYVHWVNDWVPPRMQPFAKRVGGRLLNAKTDA